MKEAIHFYKQMHKNYIWLHSIVALLLLSTILFWFIVPLFIICYGPLSLISLTDILIFISLFAIPAAICSAHCWIISYFAAKKWVKQKVDASHILWLLIFQGMAFASALSFIVGLYILFIVVDQIR